MLKADNSGNIGTFLGYYWKISSILEYPSRSSNVKCWKCCASRWRMDAYVLPVRQIH